MYTAQISVRKILSIGLFPFEMKTDMRILLNWLQNTLTEIYGKYHW